MVSDRQVRVLRKKRMEGKTLETAAAAAGMSERTARTWQRGPLPSETKQPRTWRTRPDPFAEVWATEVEPLLVADKKGELEAKTIFEDLVRRKPGEFEPGQLRTLQRRVREWRAQHGPAKEVFFPQEHVPGRMASMDFTHATELGVTIAGELFVHLFFQFVLAYSGWRFVELAFGETFEALVRGLQGGLWALGGVPDMIRQDNLSAATHELVKTGGRTLTRRYNEVAEHYGFQASRIQPGESHENGVVEKAHHLLKSALAQALLLRGSRDFPTVEAYMAFVRRVVEEKFHQGREALLGEERAALKPLPSCRLPEYTRALVTVRKWSTIPVAGRIYSVPSRLIGHEVEARLFADVVEVRYAGKVVETMPRLRGECAHRIDYRHVIWSLVRKPGAFAAYRYREDLFPSLMFRQAYDALRERRGDRADVEYVRVLHLAASTGERVVEQALSALFERGEAFDYAAVKALAQPETPAVPELRIGAPDLGQYDALLAAGEAS
ncbi:IS21 family transposase [Sorangium sp. So ce1335]|uniref:IS21 family transposase n=1 Tax=Sorangium sp. So ce1335 TaxID=3133335 RepID=UPI003F5F4656